MVGGIASYWYIISMTFNGYVNIRSIFQDWCKFFQCTFSSWIYFDTPGFKSLAEWYGRLGKPVEHQEDKQWTYDELIAIEKKLANADYADLFQLEIEPVSETERLTNTEH